MIISILEVIGTIAFSVSGAVVGIKKKMDILGVTTLGVITAIGGGIIRDIIIGAIICAILNRYDSNLAMMFGFIIILVLRLLAAKYKWHLPKAK